MNDEIEFTRGEVVNILKCLSRIDGFLFSVKCNGIHAMHEELDYPVNILTKKITGNIDDIKVVQFSESQKF